ncbi:hypothetical protein [Polaromonas sp.]|jgi:hypothetical protein|uniref:hypothetical protein n=1 Tax=Polaromonas sp. TaxID=1869339 RepID=UPI001D23E1E1|nr:hypothetical protein [Polaromonas sp.]MBT9476418.1 hypothetical protein [Polaromonas sp.]
MRYHDIKRHLKPYAIVAMRKTTINHAFASAIAPCDDYNDERVRKAIQDLGQDPDKDLDCIYCGTLAETWDHVFATVKQSEFSGHGHRLGNLLPCCKPCNSKKGNKSWDVYLSLLNQTEAERSARRVVIGGYLSKHQVLDQLPVNHPDYEELDEIKAQVLALFARADELATRIRRRNAA